MLWHFLALRMNVMISSRILNSSAVFREFPTLVLNVILRYEGLKVFCLWTGKTAFKMAPRRSDLNIKMVKNTQEIYHKE